MGGVIVLITMLVGLLSGLTSGLSRESTSAVTDLNADRLVFSQPANGDQVSFTSSVVSASQWRAWGSVSGVLAAEPLGVAAARATTADGSTSVTTFGVEPGATLDAAVHAVKDGGVVLSTQAADRLQLSVGQAVTVAGTDLTVVAVNGDASFSHTPVVWMSLTDWQKLGGGSDAERSATVIALRTDDTFKPEAAPAGEVRTISDSLSAIGSYTSENGSLQLIRGFLFVISAVVVGAFFTVWTIQRSGDIAVLKALGASDRYLIRDAVGQAIVLLLSGTTIGAALAAVAGVVAAGTVPFVLDLPTLGLPLMAMIVLGLLGAVLSVRRVTSVDPLIALGSAR